VYYWLNLRCLCVERNKVTDPKYLLKKRTKFYSTGRCVISSGFLRPKYLVWTRSNTFGQFNLFLATSESIVPSETKAKITSKERERGGEEPHQSKTSQSDGITGWRKSYLFSLKETQLQDGQKSVYFKLKTLSKGITGWRKIAQFSLDSLLVRLNYRMDQKRPF
jgi:hypothetical protein